MEPSPRSQTTLSVNMESLLSTNGQSAQLEVFPNIQTALPFNMELQQLSTSQSSVQVGASPKFQTSVSAVGSQQFRNKQSFQMEQSPRAPGSLSFSRALQQPPSINKLYVETEPASMGQTVSSVNKTLKQMSSTNKPGKMEPLTKVQSATSPTLGTPQLSAKNKRKSHVEKLPKVQSINLGNQMTSPTNRRSAHAEPSPKVQTESFQSVRLKLRESLVAALALVSDQQIKPTGEACSINRTDARVNMAVGSQQGEGSSIMGGVSLCGVSEASSESTSSKVDEHDIVQKRDQSHCLSSDIFPSESAGDYTQIWKCEMQDIGLKHTSFEGDMSLSNNLAFKDELLQENGLCWASDLDVEGSESKESGEPKRLKLTVEKATKDVKESVGKTQFLATKIEGELFRLFGGVNKKYKEKGRSLLFNLKDPNNPELRERLFSEEISPERLCSMTAEDLASKQLTEWRIAKAEELAQMVVLPESDVDLRRLVKKTHKGEFQVEVERDDNVPVEVTLGANALSQIPTRANETKNNLKSADYETENSTKHNETEISASSVSKRVDLGALGRPQDMQEFMVDELKDAEFLPPIVSLDEFMEALDSEPPFENLPVTAERDSPTNKKGPDSPDERLGSLSDRSYLRNDTPEKSKLDASPTLVSKTYKASDNSVTKMDQSHAASEDLLDATARHPDETDSRNVSGNHVHALESGAVDGELDDSAQGITSKVENIWEGLVQLNISSLVTVLGVFKSGEKASTEEWPSFLEIKGRVRVDAFEKFLQELPSSRSRAVMVVHFQLKDGSTESGLTSLAETVDSYVADERVGYAEPAPGVELYFCPPHARTIQMLERHIPKEHTEALASTDNGLIGIVVWRRPHVTSTVSPRVSSHHKHSSSRKHLVSRKQRSPTADVTEKNPLPMPVNPPMNPESQPDDAMDDVPPGFGPGAARDEDDLPEFDFRGTRPMESRVGTVQPHARPLTRQAEQMRELIHKYGQGEAGIPSVSQMQPPVQPWDDDDDDDDDIPEWRPQPDNQSRSQSLQQQTPLQYQTNPHLLSIPPPKPTIPTVPVPLAAPFPLPIPTQMGVTQMPHSVQMGWQPGAWWPHARVPAAAGFVPQGLQQPCHNGGSPAERRYNGVGGVGNPHNAPRSRGV